MELSVGLSNAQDLLTGGRDLGNFLFPIVHRFGPRHFVAAFGHKVRRLRSTLRLGVAVPADASLVAGWHHAAVSTGFNDETAAWKHEVAAALPLDAAELPPGAVDLQVRLQGGRRKLLTGNWQEYWKPTIDALGRILGEENPMRPYHPRDDRITNLGFHRFIEGSGTQIQLTSGGGLRLRGRQQVADHVVMAWRSMSPVRRSWASESQVTRLSSGNWTGWDARSAISSTRSASSSGAMSASELQLLQSGSEHVRRARVRRPRHRSGAKSPRSVDHLPRP